MGEHDAHVPAWAKWALGIAQAIILLALGWVGTTLLNLYTSVNLNTYKLNQVQQSSGVIQSMQGQISQLQWRAADIEKVQADHETRLSKLEADHGARVKGWTH